MSNPFLTKVFYFNAAHQYGHDDWSDDKNWEVFARYFKNFYHFCFELTGNNMIKEAINYKF